MVVTVAGTFKIQAIDGENWGQIKSITLDNKVTGTVNIYVTRWPDDPNGGPEYDAGDPETWYGAQGVGMIGFTSETPPQNQTINLVDMLIRGDLGPDQDDLDTRATAVTGTVQIGREAEGQLQKDLHVQTVAATGVLHVKRLPNQRLVEITGTAVGDVHVGRF